MSGAYEQLLEATIQHLKALQAQGTRFVAVSPDVLQSLVAAPRSTTTPSVAAPSHRMEPPVSPQAPPSVAVMAPMTATVESEASSSVSARQASDPAAKAQAIAELRQRASVCVKCSHLASSRKNVVFGVGDINARLMFVGEAPGADEDRQGEPFVGAAGQLLTKIIQAMGLTRDRVYIANILKCRPDTPGQSTGNRKPTPDEMRTCIPYLESQIDLIQPEVLVALGGTAVEGLLGKTGITRLRGNWQTFRNIPLMPTYHPSYLLHQPSPTEKRRVWEDMMQVMEKLGLPISEKQRRYFQ